MGITRIVLLTLVLFTGLAQSDELSLNKSFRIVSDAGQPYRYVFADGREATLKVSLHDSAPFESNLVISDNSCNNRQGMMCKLKFQFRNYWLGMVWSKNPDPQKIGRVVTYRYHGATSGDFSPMTVEFNPSAGFDPMRVNLPGPKLQPVELSCADFSWLPNNAYSAPNSLLLDRWDGEDTDTNPETGASENRTVGGVWGVKFVQVGPQTLRLQSVRGVNGQVSGFDNPSIGAAQNLTVRQPNGGVCQVGILNSNLDALQSTVDQVSAFNPKPDQGGLSHLADYIAGRDAMLKLSTVTTNMTYWNANAAMDYL